MHQPKSSIPLFLAQKLGAGVNGCIDGELEITFWEGDDEASLFLYLSPDEVRQIEDYGVSE